MDEGAGRGRDDRGGQRPRRSDAPRRGRSDSGAPQPRRSRGEQPSRRDDAEPRRSGRPSGERRPRRDDTEPRRSGSRRDKPEFRGGGRDEARSGGRRRPDEAGPRRPDEREPDGFGPYATPSREASRGRRPDETRRRDRDDQRSDRAVRSAAEEAVQRATRGSERPALRLVRRPPGVAGEDAAPAGLRPRKPQRAAPPTGRTTPKVPANPARVGEVCVRASQALERGYENQVLRLLRPYREAMPDDSHVRELMGLAYYRQGKWAAAIKELEAFYKLTASVIHHPVLMDSFRALGRHKRTDQLWEELRAVSPAADVVTEGRIVEAGSLADRGRLAEAIALLERAQKQPKHVAEHHLRLWYALADLQERAGEFSAARTLFRRVSSHDPAFIDVAERLASLT